MTPVLSVAVQANETSRPITVAPSSGPTVIEVSGGVVNTGASHVLLSEGLTLGSTSFTISLGNTFTAHGSDLLAEASLTVSIPMSPSAESLNAAVAGSILLYALTRKAPDA